MRLVSIDTDFIKYDPVRKTKNVILYHESFHLKCNLTYQSYVYVLTLMNFFYRNHYSLYI